MPKTVAIVQSNYIPWKGYFDLIASVDEFILYDDVQYTKRDFRNRNQIKTQTGLEWLTIPVETKGLYYQKIKEVKVASNNWGIRHWKTLEQAYSKSLYFKEIAEPLKNLFLSVDSPYLSEINRQFLNYILDYLQIKTPLKYSTDFTLQTTERSEKLLEICIKARATDYLSGPSAKLYLNECLFREAGIQVHYFNYLNYPEYPQRFSPFVHEVSILDMLFNLGENTINYLKHSHANDSEHCYSGLQLKKNAGRPCLPNSRDLPQC